MPAMSADEQARLNDLYSGPTTTVCLVGTTFPPVRRVVSNSVSLGVNDRPVVRVYWEVSATRPTASRDLPNPIPASFQRYISQLPWWDPVDMNSELRVVTDSWRARTNIVEIKVTPRPVPQWLTIWVAELDDANFYVTQDIGALGSADARPYFPAFDNPPKVLTDISRTRRLGRVFVSQELAPNFSGTFFFSVVR